LFCVSAAAADWLLPAGIFEIVHVLSNFSITSRELKEMLMVAQEALPQHFNVRSLLPCLLCL
jgi:hypothetical protein